MSIRIEGGTVFVPETAHSLSLHISDAIIVTDTPKGTTLDEHVDFMRLRCVGSSVNSCVFVSLEEYAHRNTEEVLRKARKTGMVVKDSFLSKIREFLTR